MPLPNPCPTSLVRTTIVNQIQPYRKSNHHYAGFSDSSYYLFNEQEVLLLLQEFRQEPPEVLSEGFDCDDFTYVFKGRICQVNREKYQLEYSFGIGIAWGKFSWAYDGAQLHATNWFLDPVDGQVKWAEPQLNQIFPLNTCLPNSLTLLLL